MNAPFQQIEDSPLKASGRFGRLSYIAWNCLISLVIFAIVLIASAIFSFIAPISLYPIESIPISFFIIFGIIYIAILYFQIVFSIRRLHDCNKSGWLVLIFFVPLANAILGLYMLFAAGHHGANNFGPQRPTAGWETILAWLYIAFTILMFLILIIMSLYMQ